jgi:hypothetical protein
VNCQKFVRIVEALENRGYRSPLTKEEADLYERLVAILKRVGFPPSVIPTSWPIKDSHQF